MGRHHVLIECWLTVLIELVCTVIISPTLPPPVHLSSVHTVIISPVLPPPVHRSWITLPGDARMVVLVASMVLWWRLIIVVEAVTSPSSN